MFWTLKRGLLSVIESNDHDLRLLQLREICYNCVRSMADASEFVCCETIRMLLSISVSYQIRHWPRTSAVDVYADFFKIKKAECLFKIKKQKIDPSHTRKLICKKISTLEEILKPSFTIQKTMLLFWYSFIFDQMIYHCISYYLLQHFTWMWNRSVIRWNQTALFFFEYWSHISFTSRISGISPSSNDLQ